MSIFFLEGVELLNMPEKVHKIKNCFWAEGVKIIIWFLRHGGESCVYVLVE